MEQKQTAPVIIAGFGVAGVNTLIGLRNGGYQGEVLVLTDTDTLPYSPILTSYYAGGQRDYAGLFPWSAAEMDCLNAQVVPNAPVTNIDVAAHTITAGGVEYAYAKCVIATGASPRSVGFPVDCGYQPLMLRTVADAQRMRDAFERPGCQRVLVSGASMVALKILEAALYQGLDTNLVGLSEHVLDMNALPQAAARFEVGLRGHGVTLRLGQRIAQVVCVAPDGTEGPAAADVAGRKLRVTFSTGEVDEYDEIAVAHGMASNLEFIPQGALEIDRALVVDKFMHTSNPDVFAVGDVAQAFELLSGEKRVVGIWKSAALQGACAGAAIAAELAGAKPAAADAYQGFMSMNTIQVKDTLFISGGTVCLTPERQVRELATDTMTVLTITEQAADEEPRLVGFNVVADAAAEGDEAYDTGAMLQLRLEKACRKHLAAR